MPNLICLRESHLDDLRSHIKMNLHYYQQPKPWLDAFFKEGAWHLSSNIKMDDIELIQPSGSKELFDLENTKLVFLALKDLTQTQASDERLWVTLTHHVFWEYMRQRWPVERYLKKPEKAPENIRERYFLMGDHARGVVRNGIARLWWYGHVSYDESRSDPFELTRILLTTLDITQSLLERAFSYNRKTTKTILNVLAYLESAGKPFFHRERFRSLMKYVNQIGGVTILDALDNHALEDILFAKIEQLSSQAV